LLPLHHPRPLDGLPHCRRAGRPVRGKRRRARPGPHRDRRALARVHEAPGGVGAGPGSGRPLGGGGVVKPIDYRYRPASSWTAICRPDESAKTLVREDGALLYGYRSVTWVTYVFDRVIELSLDGAGPPTRVEQQTEKATRAILLTTLSYPN